jgi:hypothetical protein
MWGFSDSRVRALAATKTLVDVVVLLLPPLERFVD